MGNTLTAQAKVTINAPASEVWNALTTPEIIGQYLMGTKVTTDWKPGNPITYEGEYNGKPYRDKGIVKKVEAEKLLQSTYWSSMSGKEDKPENYNLVTYQLDDHGDTTEVTLTQDNVLNDKEKEHVTKNWNMVLGKMKEVVETMYQSPLS